MDLPEPMLRLQNVTMEFPGVKALDGVSLQIDRGEIHAIVGENGAGKSTMMKIISGVYPKGSFSGSLWFDGRERHFARIKDSEAAGIAIIYQELALVKHMTVAENLFLGGELKNRLGVIDWNRTQTQASSYLAQVGLRVNPMTKMMQLGIGQQQLVEIAKALSKQAKLLILDEPTAALTEAETQNLLEIMRRLRQQGVTCVFITHKLEEIFAVCDRATVIRDGKSIHTGPVAELDEGKIISLMVGRDLTERYPRMERSPGELVLEVEDWSLRDREIPGRMLLQHLTFTLREGEVLGISGLMGAGRTELAMSLFGCYPGETSGRLRIGGRAVRIREPRDAIRGGLSYLSEDRKRYGLNMKMDIEDNMILAAQEKVSRFGVIDSNRKVLAAKRYIRELGIRTPSSRQLVVNLSGGNQQKVVLGKWLLTEPRILILDEPTRGIDVGAKYEIYHIINRMAAQGVGIILISSELPELLGMADRILVMREGTLAMELDARDADQETIMRYATGGARS